MLNSSQGRKTRRIVIYTASTIFFSALFIGLLYGLRPMLLPLILGGFLAYLFKPLVDSFRGSTLTKYIRAAGLLVIIGGVFYWGAIFIKAGLPNEKEKLQLKVRLQYRLNERYKSWLGLADKGKGNFIYKTVGEELDELKKKAVDYIKLTDEERKEFIVHYEQAGEADALNEKYYEYYLANLKSQKVDFEKLKAQTKSSPQEPKKSENGESRALATIMQTFSHWLIFPLAFIFLLLDKGQIVHFALKIIPNRYFELAHSVIRNVDEALGKYIRGTMIECALVGITLMIGFFLCGIELKIAIAIGAIGGLTNAIPFVGTFIACIIGAVYSLIAEDIQPIIPFINEDSLMLAVIAVVMIAHLLDNAIFQPLVVGSAVNIHPLVVILGVFGGSLMFGFAGLIFAIPTIVILKVVTETLFTGLKDYRII